MRALLVSLPHALNHRVFASLDQLADMPSFDADVAEYRNGDEFRYGTHKHFKWHRRYKFGIFFVVYHVEEGEDAVDQADSDER